MMIQPNGPYSVRISLAATKPYVGDKFKASVRSKSLLPHVAIDSAPMRLYREDSRSPDLPIGK